MVRKMKNTIASILDYRATHIPHNTAFTFSDEHGDTQRSLTFEELNHKAHLVAKMLHDTGCEGKTVLLLYPPCIDYVSAVYGCILAGAIAVPLYPPQNQRKAETIESIVRTSQARVALTTNAALKIFQAKLSPHSIISSLGIRTTDEIFAREVGEIPSNDAKNQKSETVYLQFTSGSTSEPKGVQLTHENIISQCAEIEIAWGINNESILVSWLPHYHDLGQVFTVLQPVYSGCHCVFTSPAAFVQRPALWLELITKHKATHTAAPNFAFDLCVGSIPDEQLSMFDLSSLVAVANGAEPVRSKSLTEFAARFKNAGFHYSMFCPAYGLAEATLKVTSVPWAESARIVGFDARKLAEGIATPSNVDSVSNIDLVSNGRTVGDTHVQIVDPVTNLALGEERIGEIWINSPCNAKGYWNNSLATRATFCGKITNGTSNMYLRTGDLGFFYDEELFIAGRIKDVIIVRGANHYPQDIEATAEAACSDIRPGHIAAFSINIDGTERVVIAAERKRYVGPTYDENAAIEKIRTEIVSVHGIAVHDVSILRPGTILRTTSGKIQRSACKAAYIERHGSISNSEIPRINESSKKPHCAPGLPLLVEYGLQSWIVSWVSKRVQKPEASISTDKSLSYYNVDSLDTFVLYEDLQEFSNKKLDPGIVVGTESIRDLAAAVSKAIHFPEISA